MALRGAKSNRGGIIRITGEGFGDWLQIVIEDNGTGMEPRQAAAVREVLAQKRDGGIESQKGAGIGIRNVVTRMHMFYGEDLDITLQSAVGEGTVFTFKIPLPKQESEG